MGKRRRERNPADYSPDHYEYEEGCPVDDDADEDAARPDEYAEDHHANRPMWTDDAADDDDVDEPRKLNDAAIAKFKLSPDQEAALRAINEGGFQYFRITGGAGRGKSHLIRVLRSQLRAKITATTGRAAINVGGITIDSLLAMRRSDWYYDIERAADNLINCSRIIVIDEASMVGVEMARIIVELATQFNKVIVLVGDWGQAAPVKDEWPLKSPLLKKAKVLRLTTTHRQEAGAYLEALDEIRGGIVTHETSQMFRSREVSEIVDDNVPRIYATNNATNAHNNKKLRALCEITGFEPEVLISVYVDAPGKKYPAYTSQVKSALDNCSFAHGEGVEIGARVVLTRNNWHAKFVNGDTGTIKKLIFREDIPKESMENYYARGLHKRSYPPTGEVLGIDVLLDRTKEINRVTQMAHELDNGDCLIGFPLRLAWALTIHKMQGMTLERAFFDMDQIRAFTEKHGLAYVGLSRTRTLEGLFIKRWQPQLIRCHPSVKRLL